MSVAITPKQSGTGDPSPTNIRPISGRTEVNLGRTGKNLLPMTVAGIKSANTGGTWNGNVYTISNTTIEILTDETGINVHGFKVNTGSGGAGENVNFKLTATIAYNFSGNYIYSSDAAIPANVYVSLSKTGAPSIDITNGNTSVSFTADAAISNARIFINSGTTVSNLVIKPMVRLATETDPTFAPYKGSITLTIALGQTVYGGNLDVKTGVLTITHAIVDLGTLTWKRATSRINPFFYDDLEEAKAGSSAICEQYKGLAAMSASNFGDTAPNNSCALALNAGAIYVRDDTYTDTTTFTTAMDGVQLCYELATPTTVQLTPTQLMMLKGYNSLSTDDGDIITITAYAINEEVGA